MKILNYITFIFVTLTLFSCSTEKPSILEEPTTKIENNETETKMLKEGEVPAVDDIFTIAFNIRGFKKESREILTAYLLPRLLENAEYLGRTYSQIRSPKHKYYWNQDGVIVLKSKQVISFEVFQDMKNEKLKYITLYYLDGNGSHLFKL